MFEVFNEHIVKEEIRQMLIALKTADYAISTLPKEDIQEYADSFGTSVILRKLRDGRVKVNLQSAKRSKK